MKKLILMPLILLMVLLSSCGVDHAEKKIIKGQVIYKKYYPAYTTVVPVLCGKSFTMIPQYHGEQFIVKIKADEFVRTYDDKGLFNEVSEGEVIPMILEIGYDKENQITSYKLKLQGE